jgi:heme exporter protein B
MLMSGFFTILQRDLLLAYRHRSELANPLLFFIIVVSLFPLGISPQPEQLALIAPGIIWVAALLAALLSLDNLFRSDFEDGSLEQIALSTLPLPLAILAKICAHWLITGLPLILISPLLAMLMFLPNSATWALLWTLALGTPILSLVGAIGVALTVGLKRGGVLVSLLVLPLYIPVLIFAANAVSTAAEGLAINGHLYLLAALLSLAVTLAPFATAAALRISLS